MSTKKGAGIALTAPKLLKMAGIGFRLGIGWETVKKETIEPKLSDILSATNDAIAEIESRVGKPVVFIDGLDKIPDLDMGKRIFAESKILSEPSCHLVYVIPFALCHSPDFQGMSSYFDEVEPRELPNIEVRRKGTEEKIEEGYEFFRKLTEGRLKEIGVKELIETDALEKLVEKSGGIVRHFITLMRLAIEEASSRKIPLVDIHCAEWAIERLRKTFAGTLSQPHIDLLKRMKKDVDYPPEESDTMSTLQRNEFVVYYDGWWGVHPLIR